MLVEVKHGKPVKRSPVAQLGKEWTQELTCSKGSSPGVRTRSRWRAEAEAAAGGEPEEIAECGFKFSTQALLCLQTGAEEFLRGIFHDSQVYAHHAKRKTVMLGDIKLASCPSSERAYIRDNVVPQVAPAKQKKNPPQAAPVKKRKADLPVRRREKEAKAAPVSSGRVVTKLRRQEGPRTLDEFVAAAKQRGSAVESAVKMSRKTARLLF